MCVSDKKKRKVEKIFSHKIASFDWKYENNREICSFRYNNKFFWQIVRSEIGRFVRILRSAGLIEPASDTIELMDEQVLTKQAISILRVKWKKYGGRITYIYGATTCASQGKESTAYTAAE